MNDIGHTNETRGAAFLQRRRRKAVRLLNKGYSNRQIADRLGVSIRSVQIWASKLKQDGRKALQLHGSWSKSRIGRAQCRLLKHLLMAGPQAAGIAASSWTSARVAELLAKRFGLEYTRSGTWHLLRRTGLERHLKAYRR